MEAMDELIIEAVAFFCGGVSVGMRKQRPKRV